MNTVVVLGAGASADFGLPMGGELFNQAAELLDELIQKWRKRSREDHFFEYSQMVRFIQGNERYKYLLPFMLGERADGTRQISLKPLSDVLEAMQTAPAYSLDTLALEFPEHADIFKTLCAQLISEAIERNLSRDDYGRETRLFDRRLIPKPNAPSESISNWVHLFCSMIRSELSSEPKKRFGIVSFNYDRLFEKIGASVWKRPTRDVGSFETVFKIKYPHGKIAWTENTQRASTFEVAESEIVFAHNKPTHHSNDDAAELVRQAEKLIFLGFHFSPENILTLDLRNCTPTQVIYQNFSGNRGLDNRVQALGFGNVRSFKGPIADAILQGELGELPS